VTPSAIPHDPKKGIECLSPSDGMSELDLSSVVMDGFWPFLIDCRPSFSRSSVLQTALAIFDQSLGRLSYNPNFCFPLSGI
jgi:hypothetical protein